MDLDVCSVCLDTFNDPRVIPCGHSFCFSCLSQLKKMECPECRQAWNSPIENLPKNWVVIKFLQIPTQTTKPIAQVCEQCDECSATLWCTKCEIHLCDGCSQKLHVKALRTHSVVNLKDKSKSLLRCFACPSHKGEEYKGHCIDCKSLVCAVCFMDEHKGHNIISLQKHAAAQRSQLLQALEPMKHTKNVLLSSKDDQQRIMQQQETEIASLREKLMGLEKVAKESQDSINRIDERIQRATVSHAVLEKAVEGLDEHDLLITEKVEELRGRISGVFDELYTKEEIELYKKTGREKRKEAPMSSDPPTRRATEERRNEIKMIKNWTTTSPQDITFKETQNGLLVTNSGPDSTWRYARCSQTISVDYLATFKVTTMPKTSNTWDLLIGIVEKDYTGYDLYRAGISYVGEEGKFYSLCGKGGDCVPLTSGDVVSVSVSFSSGTVIFQKDDTKYPIPLKPSVHYYYYIGFAGSGSVQVL